MAASSVSCRFHARSFHLPLPPEEEVAIEEFDKPKTVPEIVTVQSPSPVPQAESRIWPWPKGEAWDARRVHREVVSALELVKSGKKDEAASTIDTLGPHLTNDNIDLFYHIGMVLKQLDRTEDVRSMIQRANLEMPGNVQDYFLDVSRKYPVNF